MGSIQLEISALFATIIHFELLRQRMRFVVTYVGYYYRIIRPITIKYENFIICTMYM